MAEEFPFSDVVTFILRMTMIKTGSNGKPYGETKTVSLMPFGTIGAKQNTSALNKFFFVPIFHSQAKLGTVPRQSLRLLKFDVQNSNLKNYYHCFSSSKKTEINSGKGLPAIGFPKSKDKNGIIRDTYREYTNANFGVSSPYWFKNICGKYYTNESVRLSGDFGQRKVKFSDLIDSDGQLKTEYKKWFKLSKWPTPEDHFDGYDGRCMINATIIPDNAGHISYVDGKKVRYTKMPWGFLIGLANNKIWPKNKMHATFGTLFSVPKENTIHSFCLYFKYGAKYDLFTSNNYFTYPYNNDKQIHKIQEVYAQSDSELSSTKTDIRKARLLCVDDKYKYFVVKGGKFIRDENCAIMTPPWVAYSGNKSGGVRGPSQILDEWISFSEDFH